jgi:predicted HTH transcriptional regulator
MIKDILNKPEGRRLEFKQELPASADLAKTIVAFANDAGGDIFIGIRSSPRQLTGVPEPDLMKTEEQIASIIHDHCTPVIIPEITFLAHEDKHFIRVQIHKGSDFPYHLRAKGAKEGTYIRIGSTNRKADDDIITELERRKRNISFDSEPLYGKTISDLDLTDFGKQFSELTGEELNGTTLAKLGLVKELNGTLTVTSALVLFSGFESRKELFPYSKIECARFKGTSTDIRIDDKTITEHIGRQPEEALRFIQRHVNSSSLIEGVYTRHRWEYPMAAIREALRNAVVHRDYSLTGKDIKVAIYDDMVEITSPGTLPPSIDFQEMDARQSDIRNKAIAPVFKRLGLIDQWGNGLKIISEELKSYPDIELRWFEKGLQFQVQFVHKSRQPATMASESVHDSDHAGTWPAPGWHQVGTKLAPGRHQVEKLLLSMKTPKKIRELMEVMSWKDRSKFRARYVTPLLELGILEMTIPDKPNSSNQEYDLTEKGRKFLDILRGNGE